MIRLVQMCYVDFTGFIEDLERMWNEIKSKCEDSPPENEGNRCKIEIGGSVRLRIVYRISVLH